MRETLIDKAFRHVESRWRWYLASGSIVFGLAFLYRDLVVGAAEPVKPFFQTLAFILGPPITAIGFYLGYRAKRDMFDFARDKSEEFARREGDNRVLEERLDASKQKLHAKSCQLDAARKELKQRENIIGSQEEQIRRVATDSADLWRLRPPRQFSEYPAWYHTPEHPHVITVANFKGGVGKTTLASMLGSYVSQRRRKPVLLVDLDYQGSLTALTLLGCGIDREEPSVSERLFQPGHGLDIISPARVRLRGDHLVDADLLPANYTFAESESEAFFKYIVQSDASDDRRFAMARNLLDPSLAHEYDTIVIDSPPRMSFGVVNALAASHAVVMPTLLDKLSTDAVQRFIAQVEELKADLELPVRFAGFVGMMARTHPVQGSAQQVWEDLGDIKDIWGETRDFRLGLIPRREAIAGAFGDNLPYNQTASNGQPISDLFDPIGDRIFRQLEIAGDSPDMPAVPSGDNAARI